VHSDAASVAASSLLAILGFLALALGALLRARRTEPQHLHLAPESTLSLEHMCRATGDMLRSGSPPVSVTLDLSSLPMLGKSTLGQVEYACAAWAAAGARVTLVGCLPEVAGALWRRSVRAHVEVRAPTPVSTMLH
jgi:anti-anti-sigma regulatory factor